MRIIKKYVYDYMTRFLHASMGILIILLFITAKLAKIYYETSEIRHQLWLAHIAIGMSLSVLIASRLIWMVIGPKYAKMSSFIKIKEWHDILYQFIFTRKIKIKIKWGWGHHPLASIAYLGVYLLQVVLVFTGYFLARIQFDIGPIDQKYFDQILLLREFLSWHGMASNYVAIFFVIHLLFLIRHRVNDKIPIFSSMRTGFQYKKIDCMEKKDET